MTLSPQQALSILIPINIGNAGNCHASPVDSLSSVDIHTDDEINHQVAEQRFCHSFPDMVVNVGAIIRPQFSCPDYTMGTAREFKARLKDAPPVPAIPLQRNTSTDLLSEQENNVNDSPSIRPRERKKNNFVRLDSTKRGWEDTFGEAKVTSRKRRMFFKRNQGYII